MWPLGQCDEPRAPGANWPWAALAASPWPALNTATPGLARPPGLGPVTLQHPSGSLGQFLPCGPLLVQPGQDLCPPREVGPPRTVSPCVLRPSHFLPCLPVLPFRSDPGPQSSTRACSWAGRTPGDREHLQTMCPTVMVGTWGPSPGSIQHCSAMKLSPPTDSLQARVGLGLGSAARVSAVSYPRGKQLWHFPQM